MTTQSTTSKMSQRKMSSFFGAKPKEPAPPMIYWKTTKKLEGSTALVEVLVKAREGANVRHVTHGLVKLICQRAPGTLEIEYQQKDTSEWPVPGGIVTNRVTVDEKECSDPIALVQHREPPLSPTSAGIWDEYQTEASVWAAYTRSRERQYDRPRARPGKGKGKAKARPPSPKVKGRPGRPKGAKDTKPRAPRSNNKRAWVYHGEKAPKGRQVAPIGAAVEHDHVGRGILLEQIDLDSLRLQLGAEGNESSVIVEAGKCFAVENLQVPAQGGGSSGAGKLAVCT